MFFLNQSFPREATSYGFKKSHYSSFLIWDVWRRSREKRSSSNISDKKFSDRPNPLENCRSKGLNIHRNCVRVKPKPLLRAYPCLTDSNNHHAKNTIHTAHGRWLCIAVASVVRDRWTKHKIGPRESRHPPFNNNSSK